MAKNKEKFMEIETNYPCGNYYVNMDKSTSTELFLFQLFSVYPMWLLLNYDYERLKELVMCENMEVLLEYDRKEFYASDLAIQAFENITGVKLPDCLTERKKKTSGKRVSNKKSLS